MSDQLFQHAVRNWLEDGSDRIPPSAIDAVLLAVKTTPQERDLRIPRRFKQMPTYLRLAAAVAVFAILGVGALSFIDRGGTGGPPTPAPTPSPTAAPTPTLRVGPTATPIAPLTETFTSSRNGISISYPTGWVPRAATEPWPVGEVVYQGSLFADVIEDGSFSDTAFLALASRPLGDTPFDQWAADYLALLGACIQTEPVTVDGATGVISLDCPMALVPAGGRAYLIWLYRIDDRSQFLDVLETADLRPEDAIDTAPSATP